MAQEIKQAQATGKANYEENVNILSEEEKAMGATLLQLDQGHLFAAWPKPGDKDNKKKALLQQAIQLNKQYPGGIRGYMDNAKKLLEESSKGVNPFDGFTPSVPHGKRLAAGSPEFVEAEELGVKLTKDTCFVLVAGGLGERLGYSGIKIGLPIELCTGKTFIEYYCQCILEFQERARRATGDNSLTLPLAIMTSDDTHKLTVKLLEEHKYFGMADGQVVLMKQEKVPAMLDNAAHFAVEEDDAFVISTKPHGHGDVHMMLHSTGLTDKWTKQGFKYVVFFQDTNGLAFHGIPAALGVSQQLGLVVNSLTTPRRPGEAVGAICLLTSEKRTVTCCVEYNQLEPLLKATVSPKGDVPDATGFSPYPGNINVLVFALGPYAETLHRTKGNVSEFVNPKYADKEKTVFKKPTRLECMMQDYPLLLGKESKIGFTQFDRWVTFSAVKNNIVDAVGKAKDTGFAESAATGEADIYKFNRHVLGFIGVDVPVDGKAQDFSGVPVEVGARVVFSPSFALTMEDVHKRFVSLKDVKLFTDYRDVSQLKGPVKITANSTLVIDGEGDVLIEELHLDGALVIKACRGAVVVVKSLKVKNDGWTFESIDPNDKKEPEELRIRGYKLRKAGQAVYVYDKPGKYELDDKSS